MAQRAKLDADIAVDAAGGAMIFTDAELAVYGIFELQELERVLRGRDPRAMRAVVDAIRAKIGRPIAEEDDALLLSYYRQLKARLERGLLFRSEEHTSELQSLMRNSDSVFCLKKKKTNKTQTSNQKE